MKVCLSIVARRVPANPQPASASGLRSVPSRAVTTGFGSKTRPDPSTNRSLSRWSRTSPVVASTTSRQSCGGFSVDSRTTNTSRRTPSSGKYARLGGNGSVRSRGLLDRLQRELQSLLRRHDGPVGGRVRLQRGLPVEVDPDDPVLRGVRRHDHMGLQHGQPDQLLLVPGDRTERRRLVLHLNQRLGRRQSGVRRRAQLETASSGRRGFRGRPPTGQPELAADLHQAFTAFGDLTSVVKRSTQHHPVPPNLSTDPLDTAYARTAPNYPFKNAVSGWRRTSRL